MVDAGEDIHMWVTHSTNVLQPLTVPYKAQPTIMYFNQDMKGFTV